MEYTCPEQFISMLENQGIKLMLKDNKITAQAAPGVLTAEHVELIRQHKAELIELLNQAFIAPASFAQQRLWFVDSLEPGNTSYHLPELLKFTGELNIEALENSFRTLVERHHILRTHFFEKDGQVYQKVKPNPEFFFSVESVSASELDVHQGIPVPQAIYQAVQKELQRPFDLQQDALLRVRIFKLNREHAWLFLNLHHIVADGWSVGILVNELTQLYQAYCQGRTAGLPKLPWQYGDYSRWQKAQLDNGTLSKQLDYWRSKLAGFQPLAFPTSFKRPMIKSHHGASLDLTFDNTQIRAIRELAQQHDATPYMVLLTVFYIVLSRFSQQQDVVVGTSFANRNSVEVEGLIGFFVNVLALRQQVDPELSFAQLLQQVKRASLQSHDYQDVPFEKVVQAVDTSRDISRSPIFQVAFTMENTPEGRLALGEVEIQPIRLPTTTAKFDLTMNLYCQGDAIYGDIEFSTALFTSEAIEQFAHSYLHLLSEIHAAPQGKIAEYSLLSEEQTASVFAMGCGNSRTVADCSLLDVYMQHLTKTPNKIALAVNNDASAPDVITTYSYAQLNKQANRLAYYLIEQGIVPGDRVVICISRGWSLIYSALAVLKTGAAYIPIDPAYPQERQHYIQTNASAKICLIDDAQTREHNTLPVVNLHDIEHKIADLPVIDPKVAISGHDLAYVIYTSGSTGAPKGVMIEHGSAVNLLQAQMDLFTIAEDDKILQFAPCAFDAAVWEMLMSIFSGACLVVPHPDVVKTCHTLETFIQHHKISIATLPPVLLTELNPHAVPGLKKLISAGEACSYSLMQTWHQGRRFYNAYGPTESTVCATVYPCHGKETSAPPIGKAILNHAMYVLDKHLVPLPVGVSGEIYIAGKGLARGYLNNPDLTEKHFLTAPWNGQRLYKTGDLGYFNDAGDLIYLGRSDSQVKVNGFRIELGEIEQVFKRQSTIRDAVVLIKQQAELNKQLIAFVISDHHALDMDRLRQQLSNALPVYMLPSRIHLIDAMPLTPNGKIDKRALLELTDNLICNQSSTQSTTATQAAVLELYKNILELNNVGLHDNFFELGGHSFLALQLLNRINQRFDCQLPISQLFSAPTGAQLASVIDDVTTKTGHADGIIHTLLPLNNIQQGTPVFFIAGMGGSILSFYRLVQALDYQGPVYGLQPPTLNGGEQMPALCTMEAHASHYLEAMKQIQPQGPYVLVGHSFGAYIAFEIGQQLEATDTHQHTIAVLDTPAPEDDVIVPSHATDSALQFAGVEVLQAFIGKPLPVTLEQFSAMDESKRNLWIAQLLQQSEVNLDAKQCQAFLNVYCRQAKIGYSPERALKHTRLVVINAQDNPDTEATEQAWSAFSEHCITGCNVAGDHLSMLHHPQVMTLADALKKHLISNDDISNSLIS